MSVLGFRVETGDIISYLRCHQSLKIDPNLSHDCVQHIVSVVDNSSHHARVGSGRPGTPMAPGGREWAAENRCF